MGWPNGELGAPDTPNGELTGAAAPKMDPDPVGVPKPAPPKAGLAGSVAGTPKPLKAPALLAAIGVDENAGRAAAGGLKLLAAPVR